MPSDPVQEAARSPIVSISPQAMAAAATTAPSLEPKICVKNATDVIKRNAQQTFEDTLNQAVT